MTDFRDIKGKKEAVESMLHAIETNRVGHAYILNGPEGIGKRTLSRAFASLLLCGGQAFPDICGSCTPCRLIDGGSNPDLIVLDKGEKSIGVEDIRELQKDIVIRPMYSDRKVYIIDNAVNMTAQAQNCLLKTLEEPPAYAVLVLNVSNLEAMLETIRSRVVTLTLRRNSLQEVTQYLEERFGKDLPDRDFIAAYSEGIIGTALKLAGTGEFGALREKAINLLLGLKNTSRLKAFEAYPFFEENKDRTEDILKIMMLFYRDLLVAATTGNQKILINSDKKDMILDNARYYRHEALTRYIEAIDAACRDINRNANFQLALEVMLMKLQED